MAALCILMLVALPVLADLTVTVSPGFQFPTNPATAAGLMTLDNLNKLGQPTISVTGTLDGSTGLSPNTVSGDLLTDSVPDGTNIVWNSDSPRQLSISAYAAGDGLSGGGGAPLSVNVESTHLEIASDAVALKTNSITRADIATNAAIALSQIRSGSTNVLWASDTNGNSVAISLGSGLTNSGGTISVSATYFASTNINIPFPGDSITNSHSLGHTPFQVRWVLVATAGQYGYATNDEASVNMVGSWSTGDDPGMTTWANSSNVGLTRSATSDTAWEIVRRDTGHEGELGVISTNSWRLKVYAQ